MSDPHVHVVGAPWLQVIPAVVVMTIVIGLWRPVYQSAMPTGEQEAKIDDLARLLATPSSSADAIEQRIRSFGPFPPEASAVRALAASLIACGTAGLADAQRLLLSQRLYAITVQSDLTAATIPAALAFIQQSAVASRCDPATLDGLMRAARDVARIDPRPRRDWW